MQCINSETRLYGLHMLVSSCVMHRFEIWNKTHLHYWKSNNFHFQWDPNDSQRTGWWFLVLGRALKELARLRIQLCEVRQFLTNHSNWRVCLITALTRGQSNFISTVTRPHSATSFRSCRMAYLPKSIEEDSKIALKKRCCSQQIWHQQQQQQKKLKQKHKYE